MDERWKVINVQERMTISPTEGPATMQVIRFRTKTGYIGVVEVPQAEADPKTVREAIEVEAKRIELLEQLAG